MLLAIFSRIRGCVRSSELPQLGGIRLGILRYQAWASNARPETNVRGIRLPSFSHTGTLLSAEVGFFGLAFMKIKKQV